MNRQDSWQESTNEVSKVAERFPAALKNTRKGAAFKGIAECDDSDHPVLNCSRQAVGSDMGDLGTLAELNSGKRSST